MDNIISSSFSLFLPFKLACNDGVEALWGIQILFQNVSEHEGYTHINDRMSATNYVASIYKCPGNYAECCKDEDYELII